MGSHLIWPAVVYQRAGHLMRYLVIERYPYLGGGRFIRRVGPLIQCLIIKLVSLFRKSLFGTGVG